MVLDVLDGVGQHFIVCEASALFPIHEGGAPGLEQKKILKFSLYCVMVSPTSQGSYDSCFVFLTSVSLVEGFFCCCF